MKPRAHISPYQRNETTPGMRKMSGETSQIIKDKNGSTYKDEKISANRQARAAKPPAALFPLRIRQLHKRLHLRIEILFVIHPEMVIVLLLPRHLRDLLKAKVIGIRHFKRETDVNKILTDLR